MRPQNLVIHNGTVITDGGEIAGGMVGSRDGIVDYVGSFDAGRAAQAGVTVDAAGKYIGPGFIDIHVHGGAGSDFMDATPDAIRGVMHFHLRHGTTALCPTTATASLDEILTALAALNDYRAGTQDAGRALGTHIEGPYLTMSKRGCHLPEYVRPPEPGEWSQIVERGPIATMTLAPELPGARELVEALSRQGAVASAGHSEALYHEIEEAIEWGIKHVTHLYCAMTDAMNNRWRGTPNPRSAGIVEAVYLDDRLTSELITDGKHLSREMLLMALRNKGCEKLAIVTDAMRGAGMPDGEYTFGPKHGMRAIVRNREARIPDGTALASSVYAMDDMVRTFHELTGAPLWQVVRMASLTPAEIVGVSDTLGSLRAGKSADVVIFGENVGIERVFLGGKEVM